MNITLFSAINARLRQERRHDHEQSLSRSPRTTSVSPPGNELCKITTERLPWYEVLDHLCRQIRYSLSDKGFCDGRDNPCFTCTAMTVPSDSKDFELHYCRPSGVASFTSCANKVNYCRGEWDFTKSEKCPVTAQITDDILTGKACCHERVETGQQVCFVIFYSF